MHELEHKIKQLIDSEGLLSDGGKVIVGLSGGADSVALLTALRALNYRCVAAHCNFGLRSKEADRDQHHAKTIAMQSGSEWRTVKFDTKGYMQANHVSVEMACRELRYEWFKRLLEDTDAEAIAVAHHRDDNVETLLLNLLRGAGIHGLRGMKPRNGHVIRPMLNCTRTEVTDYLATKGLTFVTDSSNLVNDVKRNKLRNIIIPALNEQFPGAVNALSRSINALRQNELIIDEATVKATEKYTTAEAIDLDTMFAEHPTSAPALLFELLYTKGFNVTQIKDITDAYMAGNTGRQVYTSKCAILLDRGRLLLYTPQETSDRSEYIIDISHDVTKPIVLKVKRMKRDEFKPNRNANIIYLDAKVLNDKYKWVLRHWRESDRMTPFGMKGSKKLSDIFNDAKLPLKDKNRVWLLTCDEKIVWITGMRASDLFKITDATSDIIKLTYIPD